MKKLLVIPALLISAFIFLNFNTPDNNTTDQPAIGSDLSIPEDVDAVIQNSCYGCHNSDSKNQKAKLKLKFDKLEHMSTGKQVGKLTKIAKVLNKGKMPPEKFLDHYPESKLTDDQKSLLVGWAESTAKSLSE